jgi:hypothetical protein
VSVAIARLTDRMLIAGRRHLLAVLEDYSAHYNQHRPHRALNLRPPRRDDIALAPTDFTAAKIGRHRVLGGLINQYERAA